MRISCFFAMAFFMLVPSEFAHAQTSKNVECLQRNLAVLGYDVGQADGKIGNKTNKAASSFNLITKILPDLTEAASANWCFQTGEAVTRGDWAGYRSIYDVSSPLKELAMSSVFQILTVTLLEKDKDNYEVVDMVNDQTTTKVPRIRDDARTFQIETCRNQGLKRCPIFRTKETGSGFVNNGTDFYTCRHMIHNWLVIAAKENSTSIEKLSPPIELLNYRKELIYSSAKSKENIMKISKINTDPRLDFILTDKFTVKNQIELFFAFSEYTSMRSPIDLIPKINTPFVFDIADNDIIFNSGYPGRTALPNVATKNNAPGDQLVTSTGKVVGHNLQQQAMASSAVSTPGMSGGMTTTADGKIVGLACSGEPGVSTTNMLNELTLEGFWGYMQETPI